jgi:hypothetical protein
VIHHLADIESDMSAIHRITDIYAMEAGRFFAFCHRLPAYQGVLRMEAERQAQQEQKRHGGHAPQDVIPVAAGELHKIDGLDGMQAEGWLTIEKAQD